RAEAPAALLAWIPLMKRGGEGGMIQRWLEVAGGVRDARLRADLGLARAFADAANRSPAWQEALKEGDMTESTFIREIEDKAWAGGLARGRDEGIRQGQAQLLLSLLEDRFGALPADLTEVVRTQTDTAVIRRWAALAATAETLEAFRRAM